MVESENRISCASMSPGAGEKMHDSGNTDPGGGYSGFLSYRSPPKPLQPPLDSPCVLENATVLVVDDDEMVLEVMTEMLTVLGHQAFTANSGQAALQLYRKQFDCIDVVILDIRMPGMNGCDVFERMQKINPRVKAICVSGFCSQSDIDTMLAKGCCAFYSKPLNLRDLGNQIRRLLGGRNWCKSSPNPGR